MPEDTTAAYHAESINYGADTVADHDDLLDPESDAGDDNLEGHNSDLAALKKWFIATVTKIRVSITGDESQVGTTPAATVAVSQVTVAVQASAASGLIKIAGPFGTLKVGFAGGKPNFGLNLQGMISSAKGMPAGSAQYTAMVQKISVNFGAALKSRGTTATAQISAGFGALNGKVSFGSKGVFNMAISLSGKVINNAQNVKLTNKVTKPEGTHAQKSNIAMNVSKGVAGLSFSTQVGASSGVSFQTTLGTNFSAPKIGISGTMGAFKIDTGKGISFAAETPFLTGAALVVDSKSNLYDEDEDKGTSYEEEQETITDSFEEEEVQDYADYTDNEEMDVDATSEDDTTTDDDEDKDDDDYNGDDAL